MNHQRRLQTRSRRPGSASPIAHNQRVAMDKATRRLVKTIRTAKRSFRTFGRAVNGFATGGLLHRGVDYVPAGVVSPGNFFCTPPIPPATRDLMQELKLSLEKRRGVQSDYMLASGAAA